MAGSATGDEAYDVVIVGAGLAGITAARELSKNGRRILMLEARDHIGGRAWSRPFAGIDTEIEIPIGGTYIATQWLNYQAAWREVERYQLELEAPPAPKSLVSLLAGERLEGRLPLPPEEWTQLERVLVAFLHMISEIDENEPIERQIPAELDVSFADFLRSFDVPARTAEFLATRAQLSAQRRADDFSIGLLAHQIICTDHSIVNYTTAPMMKLAGGTRTLYEAIFDDADVECQLSTPVTAIDQTGDEVVVTTANGRYTAHACVVATPVSLWSDIEFDPPLSQAKRDGADTRPLNACQKVWAIVKDAPPDVAGIGGIDQASFVTMMPDKVIDEGQLMVGFAPNLEPFAAQDHEAVERAFQAFMPGCSVVAFDSHDWNADPFSQGAWMAPPPGYITTYAADMRAPEQRLVFATADIARHGMSNMAGAIESGFDAAHAAEAILATAPPASSLQQR